MGKIILLDIKAYSKAIAIKTQCDIDRRIDTEINETEQRTYEKTHKYDQLLVDKCAKKQFN